MGGDRNESAVQASIRLGLPLDLIKEAEGFQQCGDELYADNAQTVKVFIDMSTQWRVGMGGVVGLDYNVLPMIFSIRNIDGEERAEVFEGIKVMEGSALKTMREQQE